MSPALLIAALVVAAPPRALPDRMQALAEALSVLLPDVVSQERFDDPRRAARISVAAELLAAEAHGVVDVAAAEGPDALVVATLLDEEAARAAREIAAGDRRRARVRLATITGYCVSCHAGVDHAPPAPTLGIAPSADGLTMFERAELLRATRRSSAATAAYLAVLDDAALLRARPLEWASAATRGLSAAVELDRLDDARRIVDVVLATPDAPAFLRADAAQWRADLEAPARTAVELVAAAQARTQGATDRSADVLLLRARASLLRAIATRPRATDALLLLGVVDERLAPTTPSTLHELAYEACLRRAGATETGRRCYERLERAIYVDAGLDGEASLGREDVERLRVLRALVR